MRRVIRSALPAPTQGALDRRQQTADQKRASGTLDVQSTWNRARKTKPLTTAVKILKEMAGERERCMYCGDSHWTDIEHFWPKTPYPERMFRWPSMLCRCPLRATERSGRSRVAGLVPLRYRSEPEPISKTAGRTPRGLGRLRRRVDRPKPWLTHEPHGLPYQVHRL